MLRYLKQRGTAEYVYRCQELMGEIQVYNDSDGRGCKITTRLTTGEPSSMDRDRTRGSHSSPARRNASVKAACDSVGPSTSAMRGWRER